MPKTLLEHPSPSKNYHHHHLHPSLLRPKNTLNIRKLDRLDQIHIHPGIARILLILRTRQPRKRHNRTLLQPHLLLKQPNLACGRQPIHDGHAEIHEHKVKRANGRGIRNISFALESIQRLEAVHGFAVAQFLALGEDDEEFEVDGVVVDEQHAGAEVLGARFLAGTQRGDCGRHGLGDGWRGHAGFIGGRGLFVGIDLAEGAVGEGGGRGEVGVRIGGRDVEDRCRADKRVPVCALVGGARTAGEEGPGEFAGAAAGVWLDACFVIVGVSMDLRLSDDFYDPAQCIHLLCEMCVYDCLFSRVCTDADDREWRLMSSPYARLLK